jgi:hypothetical protein
MLLKDVTIGKDFETLDGEIFKLVTIVDVGNIDTPMIHNANESNNQVYVCRHYPTPKMPGDLLAFTDGSGVIASLR